MSQRPGLGETLLYRSGFMLSLVSGQWDLGHKGLGFRRNPKPTLEP